MLEGVQTELVRSAASRESPVLVEVWRGPVLESVHRGAVAVATPAGEIVAGWGDSDRVILPRSAIKMVQALPLVESGAADSAGLGTEHLALACASHTGGAVHTGLAARWLAAIGRAEPDLRCGAHPPADAEAHAALIRRGALPNQLHNNCSGKHCGFLTLAGRLGGGPEYVAPDHPVQRAVRDAIAEVSGAEISDFAIDGCSAPNFALPLSVLARAIARFARPQESLPGRRGEAAGRLVGAMAAHPELVAGEGQAVTRLIRGARRRAVVKSGAEGVFTAILPVAGLGIALKIDDGAGRAAAAAMAALLVRFGALERDDPAAALADAPLLNCRGIVHGRLRAVTELFG